MGVSFVKAATMRSTGQSLAEFYKAYAVALNLRTLSLLSIDFYSYIITFYAFIQCKNAAAEIKIRDGRRVNQVRFQFRFFPVLRVVRSREMR